MRLSVTTVIQILTLLGSFLSVISGVVPMEYAPVVAGAQTLISGVLHIYAGKKNPDGTPAAVAYQAPMPPTPPPSFK